MESPSEILGKLRERWPFLCICGENPEKPKLPAVEKTQIRFYKYVGNHVVHNFRLYTQDNNQSMSTNVEQTPFYCEGFFSVPAYELTVEISANSLFKMVVYDKDHTKIGEHFRDTRYMSQYIVKTKLPPKAHIIRTFDI